jgi:hypothetical protein
VLVYRIKTSLLQFGLYVFLVRVTVTTGFNPGLNVGTYQGVGIHLSALGEWARLGGGLSVCIVGFMQLAGTKSTKSKEY